MKKKKKRNKKKKQPEKVIVSKQPAGKTRQPWKPKIEKINTNIVNEENFVQMNKFYDLYSDIEKEIIDISTMRYMILNKLKLESIKGIMNQKFYDKLVSQKALVHEEDMELQNSMLRTMYKIDDEYEIKKLMKKLAP